MPVMLDKIRPPLKTKLRDIGRRFGLEIKLNSPRSRQDLRLVHFFRMHQIDLVIDVGANRGQFATEIFDAGYSGQIVSFEPLPKAHAELVETARESKKRWSVAPRMALSDRGGVNELHITEGDASSSLLEPTHDFVRSLPQVRVIETIKVETVRFDDIADDFMLGSQNPFLKLDVQGHEYSVLKGAMQTLSRCRGVLVEVCIDSLYSSQSKLDDVLGLMAGSGFELWDIASAYRTPQTLRIGAVDVLGFKV